MQVRGYNIYYSLYVFFPYPVSPLTAQRSELLLASSLTINSTTRAEPEIILSAD